MKVYFAGSFGEWEKAFFDEHKYAYDRLISLAYKSKSEIDTIMKLKENENVKSSSKDARTKRVAGTHGTSNKGKKSSRRNSGEGVVQEPAPLL